MPSSTPAPRPLADQDRLFPLLDRLFLLFIAFEVIGFALVPGSPIVLAAAGALLTPLRTSRGRRRTLWVVGAVLTAIVLAPFVLGALHLQLYNEVGPVHTVSP